MRTRSERSAGGVVYRGKGAGLEVALAARRTRRGDLAWGLAKGQIEPDEDPAQWADPAEVTEVFLYLASDESQEVHGQRFEAQEPNWGLTATPAEEVSPSQLIRSIRAPLAR